MLYQYIKEIAEMIIQLEDERESFKDNAKLLETSKNHEYIEKLKKLIERDAAEISELEKDIEVKIKFLKLRIDVTGRVEPDA